MKIFLVTLLILFLASSCKDHSGQMITWKGQTMGTSYMVKLIASPDGPVLPSQSEIDKILKEVNQSMSTYIPSSEISKINLNIEKNKIYSISRDFKRVLKHSLYVAKSSGGAFDPSIGPLVNLWGFGPNTKKAIPSKEQIAEAKNVVGYEKIVLNDKEGQLMFLTSGMKLDLSASAKGFAVDKIAEFLLQRKISNFMIEIGGEVRASGNKNGSTWNVAIEVPDPDLSSKGIQRVLNLKSISMATSGNYRNFFQKDGKGYSHTIDFQTGEPSEYLIASVTVLSELGCMDADSWATALMAMGPEKAIEFTKKKSIAVFLVYAPIKSGATLPKDLMSYESIEFKRLIAKQAL